MPHKLDATACLLLAGAFVVLGLALPVAARGNYFGFAGVSVGGAFALLGIVRVIALWRQ
jgi:hypothetical protein